MVTVLRNEVVGRVGWCGGKDGTDGSIHGGVRLGTDKSVPILALWWLLAGIGTDGAVLRNEVVDGSGGVGARMEQTDLSTAAFAWGQMSQFPSLGLVVIGGDLNGWGRFCGTKWLMGGLVRGARMKTDGSIHGGVRLGTDKSVPILGLGGYWRGFERMGTVLRNEVVGRVGWCGGQGWNRRIYPRRRSPGDR